ncbi:hypothetical protein NHQ30_005488 [Ciborinia camelliae]|nr:hypothetical protein NHQ30_005488 [Ciborinia camelliae]
MDPRPADLDRRNGTSTTKEDRDLFDDSTPQKLLDDGDYISLYLRCRYDQRDQFEAGLPKEFKDKLPEDYQQKVKRELARITELREIFFGNDRNFSHITKLKELKVAWKLHAIKNVYTNSEKNNARMLELEEDGAKWKQELEAIEKPPVDVTSRLRHAKLKKLIQENTEAIKIAVKKKRVLESVANWVPPEDERYEKKNDVPDGSGYGFNVSKITLGKDQSEASSFKEYKIEKYSVPDVLDPKADQDPWETETTDSIRYFHFPANNMKWIEKAIQRHYKETEDKPKTLKILNREFWAGQQHGTPYDPIHARHMRPDCKYISQGKQPLHKWITCSLTETDPEVGDGIVQEPDHTPRERGNNNIVLFMPYLHWEMDRKRAHIASLAKKLTSEHQEKQTRHHIRHTGKLAGFVNENKKNFDLRRKPEAKEAGNSDTSGPADEPPRKAKICGLFRHNAKSGVDRGASKTPDKLFPKATPCGLFLMQAAKVYEAMELEPDVKLVHSHLHVQPPFHPRRTLDQSYYFKLENTESRDRDQVVYRGTKERRKIHGSTRVIMVDQLWMYILDESRSPFFLKQSSPFPQKYIIDNYVDTIITSFPRRLGRNKPDSSGVHRCIRSRLENLRPGQVNSVYDLALLIINECSMVFFDRTKPTDERPEVLDIFADAISYVVGLAVPIYQSQMKTSAFELFWRHIQILSGQRLKIDPERARIYLNINPEGVLLREAHDIVEELRMMARIHMQQLQVTQIFSKTLESINGQVEPMHEMTGLLSLMLQELQRNNSSNSNGSVTGSSSAIDTTQIRANKAMIKQTIDRSVDLVDKISKHHNELQQLEYSAREIAEQLRDLLTLKQQQASIIEATAALDRADESVNQGRSIMIFTVITIIFLPLSFMSSIFGMNAIEFTGSDNAVMGIREQFKFMFPISIALTLFFLYLALKTPKPKLIKFPRLVFFLATFALSSYYGFTGKTKKWEDLFIYMNSQPAIKKLPKESREKVAVAYRWCAAQKAKYLTRKTPEDSQTKKPTATEGDCEGQLDTHGELYINGTINGGYFV